MIVQVPVAKIWYDNQACLSWRRWRGDRTRAHHGVDDVAGATGGILRRWTSGIVGVGRCARFAVVIFIYLV